VDYRALNAVTKPDAYATPNITDTLDSLGKSKIFSVLDMASGYFQIAMKPEDKEKAAFFCHKGHFQLVKNYVQIKQCARYIPTVYLLVLTGLKGIDCLEYLDDIICFSATIEEHAKSYELYLKG
jgi:hypothetical protein